MCRILLNCLLLSWASLALALSEDQQQPIILHAGFVELNQSTHHGNYRLGISIDQGETHIRADSATTQSDKDNQLTEATIMGSNKEQAHFWSLIAKDKPLMHAYADKIIYFPLTQDIELQGHARVEQGRHLFTAGFIRYNLKTQDLATHLSHGEQSTLIIQPELTS